VVVQDESIFPKDCMKMSASCMENIKLLYAKDNLQQLLIINILLDVVVDGPLQD
jgi:hypothetical protein